MKTVYARVHFRLIECPDCHGLTCHVNNRLPMYCLECGNMIFTKIKLKPDIYILEEWDGDLSRFKALEGE